MATHRMVVFAALSLLFGSCASSDKKVEDRKTKFVHQNKEINWKMIVPVGFIINDAQEIYENNKRGIEVTENATGQSLDTSFLQRVFGFQLDSANLFQSIVTLSEFQEEQAWLESNAETKRLFYLLYEEQGVLVDTSATSIETIDGIDFQTYNLNLLGSKKEVVMHQVFYAALIHGQDFSVSIVGDSPKNIQKIKNVWLTSTF